MSNLHRIAAPEDVIPLYFEFFQRLMRRLRVHLDVLVQGGEAKWF
jgi:hypothetical protein